MQIPNIWAILSGIGLVTIILVVVVFIIVFLVVGAIFLYIGVKAVKGKNDKFGEIFVTNLINLLVGWIPIIGCIIQMLVINARHETGCGGSIVAWLLAALLPYIVIIVVCWFFIPGVAAAFTAFFGGFTP